MSLYIKFLSTYFCDKKFLLSVFSDRIFFYMTSLCFSLIGSCFCDGNHFFTGHFFFVGNFCLKETCFSKITFFLGRKLVSATESSSFTTSFFLWFCFVVFCPEYYFLEFYMGFSGKSFREKWKFQLCWITKITTLWSPYISTRHCNNSSLWLTDDSTCCKNELFTEVFVEQPLALPESAKKP